MLDMLARSFGEETFLEVLRALLRAVSGKAVTTEDFVTLIEKITDVPLATFAQQFIYDTGLPKVYYDLKVEPAAGGQWRIHGEAVQQ